MVHPTNPDNSAIESSLLWRALALHLANCLPFGVVLMDRHARILEMNGRAAELVEGRHGLRVADGRVIAAISAVDATLQDAISSMVLAPAGASHARRVLVPGRRASDNIQMVITSTPGDPHAASARNPAVILMLFGSGLPLASTKRLMDQYGLTPAEAHVACRLVAGESAADIGAGTGTTLNTVRTHIRRILVKAGCRTQVELLRAILAGPAALADPPAVIARAAIVKFTR